jgi:hypothetical protein
MKPELSKKMDGSPSPPRHIVCIEGLQRKLRRYLKAFSQ